VHLVNIDGKGMKRLTRDPDNGMYPAWSPDGSRIAFMSWRNGKTEIFTMNADGSAQTKLVGIATGDVIDPRWSPDGEQIVFAHLPGGMNSPDQAIWIVNVDGTGLKQVTGK
jgi:Tol biopolymer transport system component